MKTKVFIAIPTTGNIRTELAVFLLRLTRQNYETNVGFTTGGGIAHNRNHLVDTFLKTDYEWFLFIDSDTVPPMNVLDMTMNGKSICSGIYHQWQHKTVVPVVYSKVKKGYSFFKRKNKGNMVEVDGVGAGCLLIHRKVFEKIERPYFVFLYDENGYCTLGEDFNFCKKAQKAGFKIWVDKRICAHHYKIVDLKSIFLKLHDKLHKNKTMGSGGDETPPCEKKGDDK